MAIPYQRIVAEDIDLGRGTVDVQMPAGGSAPGHQVNLGTFGLPWFLPTDYGAVGDGVADDTSAVQAAFDAAAVAGGTVYFPDGTYLCTANITVGTGATKVVNVLGPNWATGGILFSGAAVDKGLYFLGAGSPGAYAYCGTVQDLHIAGQNGALRGLTFYNVNHPRAVRVRLTGFAGAGAVFDYTLMGRFEHCLLTGCGSATEGSVEVDHSTTFRWDHSRISGGTTTIGGLLIDRTAHFLIEGGAIESCGTPILLASKAEATTPTIDGLLTGIDLERPGLHYLEMGYGWSGTTFNGVKTITVTGVTGTTSGATDVRYGAKLQDTIDAHFVNCSFGLTSATAVATFWLEGNTVLGLRTSTMRRAFAATVPWVMANGAQLSSATPLTEWSQGETAAVNTPGSLSDTDATPSLLINSQGGLHRYLTIAQSVPTTITRLLFAGGATGIAIFVKPLDNNTTFAQATASTQGMFKLIAGLDTPAVSGKVYQFVCDGTFWIEVGQTPLQAQPIGSTTVVGTDADLAEKTLATFTIPANVLTQAHTTGFTLDAFFAVVAVGGTVRVKCNGVTVATGPYNLIAYSGGLALHLNAQRAGATSIAGFATLINGAAGGGAIVAATGFTATIDPATTTTIEITGQNDSVSSAARVQFNRGFLMFHGSPDRAFT